MMVYARYRLNQLTIYVAYEKILWGNVKEKVEVSRIFLENMKIRQKYEENPT